MASQHFYLKVADGRKGCLLPAHWSLKRQKKEREGEKATKEGRREKRGKRRRKGKEKFLFLTTGLANSLLLNVYQASVDVLPFYIHFGIQVNQFHLHACIKEEGGWPGETAQKKRALAAPAEDQFHSHHPHYGAQPPSTPVLASIYIYTHKLKKQFIKAEGGSLQFGFTLLEC